MKTSKQGDGWMNGQFSKFNGEDASTYPLEIFK